MPRGGQAYNDFHEEQKLGKVYDSKLVKRLMKYTRPYLKYMVFSVFVLLILSGLRVFQPYLVKIGIDDYIIFNYAKVDLSDTTNAEINRIRDTYAKDFIELNTPRTYLFDSKEIDPKDAALLKEEGVLEHEKYYVLDYDKIDSQERKKELEDIVKSNSEQFELTGDDNITIVSYSNLRELPPEQLKTLRSNDRNGILRIGFIYLGALILIFFFQFLQVYMMAWIGQKLMSDIRNEVYTHLQKMSLRFFDSNPVGRLVTRSTNDVNVLSEMFTSVVINIFSDMFLLIGISIMLLIMNWRLGLVLLAISPIIMTVTLLFRFKFRDAYRKVRIKIARINAMLSEHFSGISVIKIFAREAENIRRAKEINRDYYKATMYELSVHAVFSPVIVLFRNLGLSLIIWYGGGQVIQNLLPLGALVAYLSYIEMFFRPINSIAEKFNIMQAAMASSERIFQILDTKPDIVQPEKAIEINNVKGEVEFKNVEFAYKKLDKSDEWEWVLRDISFHVEPGESVAFVGATGAGKTTIISLLSRFYDVQKGSINVDGVNIKNWDKFELRKNIGVVLQDVFLFARDIKSNIRLNNSDIDDDTVRNVSQVVNASHFIDKLPENYDEPVTERGSTLSAGQRQLLAFARALAFDPKILVLDEATANIDTETEQLIQEALQRLMKGRTSIIIAHRLSTIQHVDRILVMHKGKIMEEGNHQELLAKGGIYYKLYQLQYKGQEV